MLMTDQTPTAEPILPVYVIYGPQEFLRRQRLAEVVRTVLGGQAMHMAVAEHDGQTAELADVLDEMRTLPFLAERRLVVVREADAFVSAHREALERYLQAPSPTGVLVLLCKRWPGNTRLARRVKTIGRAFKCEELKGRALVEWMLRHAESTYDKQLRNDAAWRLKDLIGTDLGRLDNELAKLALFVGQRASIAAADVEALVGTSRQERIFAVADAIVERDTGKALSLWQQVITTDRNAPFWALGGLAAGIRRMMTAQQMAAAGQSLGAIKSTLFYYDTPDQVRRRIERFSPGELQQHLRTLLDADLASKTGRGSVERAVERFIVQVCTA